MSQSSGFETPNNPLGDNNASDSGSERQPTAYQSMDTGSASSDASNMGQEGQTTSAANHAADRDDRNRDADELDGPNGSNTANRQPLENGDTGYAG